MLLFAETEECIVGVRASGVGCRMVKFREDTEQNKVSAPSSGENGLDHPSQSTFSVLKGHITEQKSWICMVAPFSLGELM